MPIHEDRDLQLGSRRLGGIQGRKHLPARVIILQVERCDQDPLPRLGDEAQQGFAKRHRTRQGQDAIRRHRNAR